VSMISSTANKTYPKKYLGQNYLKDENICRNIVTAFNVKPAERVIEIGPGKGALTKYLVRETSNFLAVELDKNNCDILKNELPDLKLLNKDFLALDLRDIISKYFDTGTSAQKHTLRIIGNIPYSITSGILFKLVDERELIHDAQLMVQEEVAQRITASPNTKDYGVLSVQLQVFTKPELLFKVSKNCFSPKPKVDSRVIKFDFTNNLESKIHDVVFFRKFVRVAFSARRKTLRNSLKNMNIDTNVLGIDFDFTRRAENLEVSEFIELGNFISKINMQC
jgi:16S rRNA (adenine1518-N6/adenine1519-N6)-dimethyltransferase